jgi:hypothetical protein
VGLVVVPPLDVLPPTPLWPPSDDEHPVKMVETAKKYPRDSLSMVKAFFALIIPRSVPGCEGIQLKARSEIPLTGGA